MAIDVVPGTPSPGSFDAPPPPPFNAPPYRTLSAAPSLLPDGLVYFNTTFFSGTSRRFVALPRHHVFSNVAPPLSGVRVLVLFGVFPPRLSHLAFFSLLYSTTEKWCVFLPTTIVGQRSLAPFPLFVELHLKSRTLLLTISDLVPSHFLGISCTCLLI